MRLESIEYREFEGTAQEWALESLRLGSRNLLVGRNASGKSRVLNVINSLACSLTGSRTPSISGEYKVIFADAGNFLDYQLKVAENQVVKEEFAVGGKSLLSRGPDGIGTIWAEEIDGGKEIRFQIPKSTLAAVARRDAIQHKFLEPLHAWGSSVRHYQFGTPLGKDHLAVLLEKGGVPLDERDPNAVVALYRRAEKEFKDEFERAIAHDMGVLDYDIERIGIQPPLSIRISGAPGEVVGLYVKEKDLPGITDQHSMSQGMFRALSVLVHVNYSRMAKNATCILIDDIGEGLDFQRSCQLIDVLRHRAEQSNVQLILSTNDRFVMNAVPLEEWSVLQRQGGRVRVRNYENSRDVFEQFRFTGLSNFSFLEMDFLNEAPAEEVSAHE